MFQWSWYTAILWLLVVNYYDLKHIRSFACYSPWRLERREDHTGSRSVWFRWSCRGRIADMFGKRVSFWCFVRNMIVFDVGVLSQMGWRRTADERQIMEVLLLRREEGSVLDVCSDSQQSITSCLRFIKEPLSTYKIQKSKLAAEELEFEKGHILWKNIFVVLWVLQLS